MSSLVPILIAAAVLSPSPLSAARLAAPPLPPPPSAAPGLGAAPAPPAPAFVAGRSVTDSRGAVIGTIEGVAEDPRDEMVVVVKIDGKLVSIPESSLKLRDGGVVSTKTKAEILAAAGVTR